MEKSTKRCVGCDLQISSFHLFNAAAQMLIHAKEYDGMSFQIISPPHFNLSQYFPVKGGYHRLAHLRTKYSKLTMTT